MLSSNIKTQQVIDKIQEQVNNAKSYNDLTEAIFIAKAENKKLEFNNLVFLTICLVSLLAVAILWANANENGGFSWFSLTGIYIVLISIVGLFSLLVIWGRESNIPQLNRDIYRMWGLLDNKLNCHPTHNGNVKTMLNDFEQFKRGNCSREIEWEYRSLAEISTSFYFYNFIYTERTRTTKGTKKLHYYHYGLILPFTGFKDIHIISDGKTPCKTHYSLASAEFNKHFKLGAKDPLLLSKFLKPMVIEALVNATKELDSLNVEINANEMMCISFSNADKLYYTPNYGLNSPDNFLNELNKPDLKLPMLTTAIQLYNTFVKYSDKNF